MKKFRWFSERTINGVCWRLYRGEKNRKVGAGKFGIKTPYFIYRDKIWESLPKKYFLYGAGREPFYLCDALYLGSFNRLAEAKAEAVRLMSEVKLSPL